MLLTSDQLDHVTQFFQSRSIDPRCSVCGADDWLVEDLLPPAEDDGVQILRRGSMVPLLQVECRNCGQVLFFNAVTLGLASPE